MKEDPLALALRRGTGLVCLVFLMVGFLSFIATLALHSEWPAGFFILLAGAWGPFLGMIAHLNLTQVLSREEKAIWRKQLWVSPQSFFAAFTYLLSRDLRKATEQMSAK
jgi:hypothetical protein